MIQSLAVRPPLNHSKLPFVVMWSEKAGCTSVVKWFFWQVGLLEEALAHHSWVHNYENDVFKARKSYLDECVDDIEAGKPVIKFVRNPYRRAFSGYLELCGHNVIASEAHWTKNVRGLVLQALCGYPAELEYAFSFNQFVDWLVMQAPNQINLHLRAQYSDIEQKIGVRPVQIESSKSLFRTLEKEFGLKDSSAVTDMFDSGHHHAKTVIAPQPAINIFDLAIPARRSRQFKLVEPTLEEYAMSDAGRKLRQFFHRDFTAYGY